MFDEHPQHSPGRVGSTEPQADSSARLLPGSSRRRRRLGAGCCRLRFRRRCRGPCLLSGRLRAGEGSLGSCHDRLGGGWHHHRVRGRGRLGKRAVVVVRRRQSRRKLDIGLRFRRGRRQCRWRKRRRRRRRRWLREDSRSRRRARRGCRHGCRRGVVRIRAAGRRQQCRSDGSTGNGPESGTHP